MRHHNLQVTGSVSVNGISAATAADLAVYTGSNDTKVSTLQSFTASISTTNTFTASANSRLGSIETISASNIARINAIEIITSSTTARLNSIETISASNIARIGSLETISASNIARIGSLETISASNIARINSLESTSASVDSLNIVQNTRLTNLEIKTGSLASTGSNTFIGTQTITGSLYISSDLIVQGSSSLQNITASAVSIGTNIINLNTANPAIRYAGLSIGDSGSIGSSGSFFYDSVQDEMIFVHRGANTTVTSSVVLMGPQTYDNIGNETYLTTNRIPKGAGNEHLADSNISDTGTLVTINSVTSSFTGVVGMGTTTPIRKLDIVATGEQLRLSYSGDNNAYTDFRNDSAGGLLVNTSAGYIIHYIAGSPIMRMDANGNVGIGLTNPTEKLDVYGSVRFKTAIQSDSYYATFAQNAYYTGAWLKYSSGYARTIQLGDGISFKISNAGAGNAEDAITFITPLAITDAGNVGIGITNPSYPLHVNGSIRAGSGNSSALLVAATGTASTQAAIAIQQLTTEGDTIIFADFEPYATYGIVAKNDVDSIDFNAGNSSAGLTSYNIVNRTGTTVPAYVKTRIDLSNGYLSVGGRVGIGTISPIVSLDMGYKTDAIALPKGTTGQRPSAASGMIRYNTSLNYVEYYDGSNWIPLLPKVTLGASAANPAESAYEIKTYNAFATNGFYWIKQTGATPIYVYCVFTDFTGAAIAGGPWTVPFVSGDANSNFSTTGTTAAATFLSKCQAIGINTPGRGMESSRTTSEVYGAWLAVKRALWEGYGSFITNGNTAGGAVLRMPMININGEGGASAHRLIYNTSLSTHIPPNIDGDACNANQLFCGWWGANDATGWRTNNNDLPGPEDWGPSDTVNTSYNGSGISSALTMCVYR